MVSELAELREELLRTRDDLERMKSSSNSRAPTSIDRSRSHPSPRLIDRRRNHDNGCAGDHPTIRSRDRYDRQPYRWDDEIQMDRKRAASEKKGSAKLSGGSGVKVGRAGVDSGRTSPPTSGESVLESDNNRKFATIKGGCETGSRNSDSSGHGNGSIRYYSSPGTVGAEAEATLCDLELEGVEFKNWTEEASSIAVRLIEEVKALRWERESRRSEQATAARAFAELRTRTDTLEQRLLETAAEAKRSNEALVRARKAEKEQARAAEIAREDLRAAREKEAAARAQESVADSVPSGPSGGGIGISGGLREQLRREREGADALQRRLDTARAKLAAHERERKEWRASRARLEELRLSWGQQLKKVEKKMRAMSKENSSLKARVAEAEGARDRADAETFQLREELRRMTEQRDNLLLGATRAGHASSPADALAEILAAAAAGVAAGTGTNARAGRGTGDGTNSASQEVDGIRRGLASGGGWNTATAFQENEGDNRDDALTGESGRRQGAEVELLAALEQARAEAKLAKVAAQQERLRREGAAREKDEAVRQLHRLMGAARRAMDRRDTKLRSSRLETEVVWNALRQAVRD